MTIDSFVPLIEEIVKDSVHQIPASAYFSYRHALEIHALGVVHKFVRCESDYLQVCLSIVITTAISNEVWIRILWKREKLEFPREERKSWKFPISEEGVRAFEAHWPMILQCMNEAIERAEPSKRA